MDIRKLQRAIVDGLEDVKAQDIVVFNTEHLSPLFERVVVASGTSNRQTKALAASVRDRVKAAGGAVLSVEGEDNGEWIIVDCGSAVAHIMQPAIRQYYHLEEIWGGKPVRMKLGAAKTGLVKASESVDDDEADDTASDAGTVAPRKAPARKRSTSAAEAAASGNKAAAKKAPARKAPVNKAATDTKPAGAARKTAGKPAGKTTARKTAPRSTAKVKTIVISPPVRKTAAKTAKKRAAPKA